MLSAFSPPVERVNNSMEDIAPPVERVNHSLEDIAGITVKEPSADMSSSPYTNNAVSLPMFKNFFFGLTSFKESYYNKIDKGLFIMWSYEFQGFLHVSKIKINCLN